MRSLRLIVSLAAALVAGSARPSAAQTAAPAFDVLLAESHQGETVYLTDLAGKTVKGRVVTISAQSIELLVHGDPREWRASDVGWITQRRRFALRGTVIGLSIGAVLGAATAVADSACGTSHYKGCSHDDLEMTFVLAGLLGGIGGGVGAAVGAATRSEHVLYVAPTRQTDHVLAPIVAPGAIGVRARLRF